MKLIKVPFSGGGLGKANGAEKAPDVVVGKLKELYSNEDGERVEFEIEEVKLNQTNIEETNKEIEKKISEIKEKVIIIGGDHSITYPCFKGFIKNNPGGGIIVFDAHPDCENNFSPPTQEDYLRVLIEEDFLDAKNVVIIGIRNWDSKEIEFLEKKKIKYYSMKSIFEYGAKEICELVMEKALKWPSLYLSVDIDAVDPAFAPGTGYNEPGGLTSRELLHFIQRIKRMKNFKMADIVEINPSKDCCDLTVKLGAKIVGELT